MSRASSPRPRYRLCVAVALSVVLSGCAGGPEPETVGGIAPGDPYRAFADGDFERAVDGFKRLAEAPAAGPDRRPHARAEARANLGVALDAAGRHREALEALDLALGGQPDTASIHFNRAIVLTHLGRYEAARDDYMNATRLAPENADILYNMGILYEIHLNQPDRALAAYRQYLQRKGPHGDRVAGWIAAITQRQAAK